MKYQHTPFPKKDPYQALQFPVYHSVAFEFDSAEAMEAAFTGRTQDHCYARITNPTVAFYEKRIAELTDAHGVTALNSGMAAISNTFLTLAWAGSNIVTSHHLFGNTWSFFASTLAAFGVETRFCDLTDPKEVSNCIDEQTCALYLEVITNPQQEVADLNQLSRIAHEKGIPLLADTTLVPFCVWSAREFGVDIEIISSTKYLSGGATSLGGLILDYGSFDWSASPRLGALARQEGHNAFTFKLRREIHRNLGAYMTPQVAYQQSLGLETLPIRYERAARTCLELAEALQHMPGVVSVQYTGLPEHPFHAVSERQFGPLPGAMLTFDLESRESCFSFLNGLKLIKRATNLFDNKSLIIHPASTIYGSFSPSQRKEAGIEDTNLRLSTGLEDTADLLDDIRQSLEAMGYGNGTSTGIKASPTPTGDALTGSEMEILRMLALGKTTKEIAAERFSSVHTISTHRKNIFRKLDVSSVYEATKYALRAGIVDSAEYYI